ncbi:MAG: hypothetical protein GXO93_01235 [FCB group bacterium]|nr:hypothetical protein [FCB group bacterium]
MLKELLRLPNLLSLSRILLTPFIGYYLSLDSPQATIICIALLVVAGLTDGFDGYLARRLNQVSQLGIALDPIADKIFAGGLVILLVLYRNLPLWLALVIIGRDLLIIGAGFLLLKDKKMVVPSNLTGKYAFAAIAFLLGSYVIRFSFGIHLTTYLALMFIIASIFNYLMVFIKIRKTNQIPVFQDKPIYKKMRMGFNLSFLFVFFFQLWKFYY